MKPESSLIGDSSDASNQSEEEDIRNNNSPYVLGWKTIFLLQFQPEFEIIIMIGIYITYILTVTDAAFVYSTNSTSLPYSYVATGKNLIYSYDVIYMIDILLMISYKNTEWVEMKHQYDERHAVLILLDIISIVPFDAVYFSLSEANIKAVYCLRLRYVLRIFRLSKRINQLKNTIGLNHLLMEFLNFFINITLIVITLSSLVYFIFCNSNCILYDTTKMIEIIHAVVHKMTSKGFPIPKPKVYLVTTIYVLTNCFSYLIIYGFTVGLFLISFSHRLKIQQSFENVKEILMLKIVRAGVNDVLLIQTFESFFSLYWKNRKGYRFKKENVTLIPETMAKEISLDICWDLLKHSHLFRNKETHFIRYVAPLLKQNFLIPGEVVFKRNTFKGAMIYIITGVIQILSEEDGETPILSFSGGTLIGESTLLIDYPSTCNVVCQSYCEVYILYRKDFIKVVHKFPAEYKLMLKAVEDRYEETRQYLNLLHFSYKESKYKKEVLILKWLKMTLNELITKDAVATNKYKNTLHLEDRHRMQELDKLIFCPKYLDMLVVSEQIELVTDSVFLQTSCPCILQPDSFIVITWVNFINVATLLFALVYPYYASFQPSSSKVYILFSYIISILWVLDIYVKLSTAIKTKEGIIANIASIAMHRMQRVSFCLDVFASIPLELFALVLLGTMDSQFFTILQAPRLLKMYRITKMFAHTGLPITTQYFVKNIIYLFYATYYVAAILHLNLCYGNTCIGNNIYINFIKQMSKKRTITDTILLWLYISTQLVTNVAIRIPAEGSYDILYGPLIIFEFTSTLFYIYFLSSMSVTQTLKKSNILKLREYASNIKMVLKNLNLNPLLYKQVEAHIRGQLKYNEGIDLFYSPNYYHEETHPLLVKETRRVCLGDFLKKIPLFTDLPEDLLANITQHFYTHVLTPGEVIAYAGEVCKEMHVILVGFCEVLGAIEKENQIIGSGAAISAIEICFRIRIVRTVITKTHCTLISLPIEKFAQAYQSHPEFLIDLKAATNALVNTHLQPLQTNRVYVENQMKKKFETNSFKYFGYNLDTDTIQGADYHKLFDKLGLFGFLRYAFPRHTIRSYGDFLHYWEISRCIFAFITSILAPIGMITACDNCVGKYIMHFLDATAWADIVIRHYVSYFDEKGIEISHPLKTAVHYWKHAFIIDLLGVLPFEYIITPMLYPQQQNKGRVLLKMLRLLQSYRIFNGISYLEADFIFPSTLWTISKFIPIIIMFANIVGSFITNIRCEFSENIPGDNILGEGISCGNDSWFMKVDGTKPISPLRIHLYAIFLMLILVTGPGVGGFNIQTMREAFNVILITNTGYLFFQFITSKIVSINLFRNSNLTSYQEEMRNLIKFLECKRIDTRLRHEIIQHFELVWLKKKGNDLHTTIKCFNYALQEDILLDIYGKAIKNSIVFAEADDSFLRSLLLTVKHEIVMNRGIVLKVNDINDTLYFVYKGKVEVLGPDYNRLLTLPVGSIFGNIDECERSRQTLTMVAKGHVELFSVPTMVFHKILSSYYNLRINYHKLIGMNTDYLVGDLSIIDESYLNVTTKSFQSITSSSVKSSFKSSGILATIKKINVRYLWENTILIIVCFLASVVELVQLTIHVHTIVILVTVYSLDFIFLIHIYLNFQTSYENEFGVLVYDKKQIILHYVKDPLGFPYHLACIFPFELIALFLVKTDNAWLIWSYCRCNRLLRIYIVIQYFRKRNQQLNINVTYLRTLFLLVWVFLLLQTLNWILLFITCLQPSSTTPPTKCNTQNMTTFQISNFYTTGMSLLLSILTSKSIHSYFPNTVTTVILMMVLFIIIRTTATFLISDIATTLDITLNNRLKYEHNAQQLEEHMMRESISPSLFERIHLYIKLLWKINNGLQFPEFVEIAPYYLREGVLNSMFGCHLRKHPLFRLCHTDMIRQIAAQLRTRTFFPGDYITFINDIDECMYFIHEGAVDCLDRESINSESIVKILYKGEMFGFQQGVYGRYGHQYTYRANQHSIILVLKRNTWIHLLDFYPASKHFIYNSELEKKFVYN